LRLYETMLIVDASLSDGDVDKTLARFTTLVTEQGGEIRNTEKWGRRRLAFEIEGAQEGFYTVYTYTLEPASLKAIDAALPFVDGLVRHKTVVPGPRTRKTRKPSKKGAGAVAEKVEAR
jgi:small subunit ribosomal protein S6